MWKENQNATHTTMYCCKVNNFKQYLKAIRLLFGESDSNWWDSTYGLCNWCYEDWHCYFGTKYIDFNHEDYVGNDDFELPNPMECKLEEHEIQLIPDSYPAILVWNCDESELSIFLKYYRCDNKCRLERYIYNEKIYRSSRNGYKI